VAVALRTMGRLSEARARLDESIAIFTAIDPSYPLLPKLYNNRAVIALYEDRFAEAERDFRAAAAGMRATMGADHPYILGIDGNVAMAVFAQGRLPEALEGQESVLARTLAVYGEESMEVADAAANVGDVLHEMERFDEAAAHYERALGIRVRLGGADHIATARAHCNMGMVEVARDHDEAAIEHYARCLAVTEKSLGADSAQLAPIAAALGGVLFDAGRRDEGMAHLQRGLDLATSGETTPTTLAQIRSAVARAQWEQGVERAKARQLVHEAHEVFAAAGGRWADEAAECAAWLKTHRL
jgi:tetratricopeptide (TPR) repeat protein